MTSEITAAARTASGYGEASGMRQAPDMRWVLDSVPAAATSLLDLGCGPGALLAAAFGRLPGLRRAVGMDASPDRIAEAERNLSAHGSKAELLVADLRTPPPLAETFEVVTLTAVLHWLHPGEERLLDWIGQRLRTGGTLLLTTYHPATIPGGLGGTDLVAAEALEALGIDAAAAAFAAAGVVPLGLRCRTVQALEELFGARLRLLGSDEREAIVTITDPPQYQRFHAATFGTYYSRAAGRSRQDAFFEALGAVAADRMRRQGYVTRMPVRLWRLAR